MTKCFVYLRVSGHSQIEGDGFDRQILACESYAASHDLEIAEVFREEGVSGTKELEDRPALSELFAALEENGIKTVLIEKVDRLARDLMVQESIIGDMQKSGYTLISVAEPDLCSTDPSRILIRQIFGALAQYDRAMIVLKLRGARQRKKAKQGKCEGAKEFGYYTKEIIAAIVAEGETCPSKCKDESEALFMMRSLRAAGQSCDKIAEALNANGVPARRGGQWLGCTVNRILKREVV
jgi:DNA invertase Pin-like site-specific DNA recombinase